MKTQVTSKSTITCEVSIFLMVVMIYGTTKSCFLRHTFALPSYAIATGQQN